MCTCVWFIGVHMSVWGQLCGVGSSFQIYVCSGGQTRDLGIVQHAPLLVS